MDPNYPTAITFLIKVMGVPLHYWADQTSKSIGDGIGKANTVDLNNSRVRVVMDGLKPLVFETMVDFNSCEETLVQLRYEKIHGYCRTCCSMCHEIEKCPSKEETISVDEKPKRRNDNEPRDPSDGSGGVSYKRAVALGRKDDMRDGRKEIGKQRESSSPYKGKSKAYEVKDYSRSNSHRREYGHASSRYDRGNGEGTSRGKRGYSRRKQRYMQVDNHKGSMENQHEDFVLTDQ